MATRKICVRLCFLKIGVLKAENITVESQGGTDKRDESLGFILHSSNIS